MEEELVSILIPVYNRVNLVGKTIESAINQTYKNIEIIICDNYSSDGTWKLLESLASIDYRIKIYRNDSNIGPMKNWAKCLEKSNGEYIKFLWSDDTIDQDFIYKCARVLKINPSVGFVYTRTKVMLPNQTLDPYRYGSEGKYLSKEFIEKSILKREKLMPVSPGCALFRRADILNSLVVDIINPKNLDFSFFGAGNDLLIFLETCHKYQYFYYLDEYLSTFYAAKDSFTMLNNLEEYYLYSCVHFLSNKSNYEKIKNQFYTYLWLENKYHYMTKKVKFKIAISYYLFIKRKQISEKFRNLRQSDLSL